MKVFLALTAVLCLYLPCSVNAVDFKIGQLLTSARDITSGVAMDVGNLLPTPQGLFQSSKNLITGFPLEYVSSAINQICSSALSSNTILSKVEPDINVMKFQLRTPCNNYSFPLLKANEMWKSPHFDPKKKVVIFVTGWTTNVNETEGINVLAKAYHCREDTNFIALDAGSFVDTLYTWSAFNTETIGSHLAEGLKQLVAIVPVSNIHLIGHSLGAHIVGSAAKYFNERTGKKIPRVTGLDPAKPCFNEGEMLSGLLRGYPDFIDVIHSNPGVLGKREPLGDVDFYPGGLYPVKEGCLDVACAHERAWRYYAETVYPNNERNFLAKRCSSLMKLREGKCPGDDIPMGFALDPSIKGNYFMEINGDEPYGQSGLKENIKKNEQCGKCVKT